MPVMTMNPVVRTRFGTRLRGLRKARHMKQEALGEALGYSRSMISEIEKGHQAPPLDKAVAIAEYFGVPLDALVNQGNDQHAMAWMLPLRSMALAWTVEGRQALAEFLRTIADEVESLTPPDVYSELRS